jgi:hypothetical protein
MCAHAQLGFRVALSGVDDQTSEYGGSSARAILAHDIKFGIDFRVPIVFRSGMKFWTGAWILFDQQLVPGKPLNDAVEGALAMGLAL